MFTERELMLAKYLYAILVEESFLHPESMPTPPELMVAAEELLASKKVYCDECNKNCIVSRFSSLKFNPSVCPNGKSYNWKSLQNAPYKIKKKWTDENFS